MAFADFLRRVRGWRLLPPADKEFYDLFNETTAALIEASDMLINLFDTSSQDSREIEVKISTTALRLDCIGESIEDLLAVAQQPPFDRGDISEFKDDAIRIMKYIKHAANRYVVYDFPSSDKEMRELAPLIKEACEEIGKAPARPEDDRVSQ